MAASTRKRHHSETSANPAPGTSSKKNRTNTPVTPIKGKSATHIYRALAASSRPVAPNSRPALVNYPSLDQFWLAFGDAPSSQYLKSAATLEDYSRLVKYFHGRLVLLVRGLHLPEVSVIFRATTPAWHNSAESEVQDALEEAFESAYDWANAEVTKKIRAYSRAWFQSPAGQVYKEAWTSAKINKSSRYPYPDDPKMPEDMLSFGGNAGLEFVRTNVIDFWLVGLASVETEETPKEKSIGWIASDSDGSWYRALRSAALMLILKYSMLVMGMPEGKVYDLAVAAMMRSVMTFDLSEGIEETHKLALVCRKGRESLMLEKLEAFGKGHEDKLPETETESSLTASSPRLDPGVRAADAFRSVLVDPPESRFVAGEGLADMDHIRRHARAVIDLEKEFEFSLGPHRLDTLSPPVLSAPVQDEVAHRYSRLPLERADYFHQKRIEQEIARLEIIISQAANRASALKSALARVTKRRVRYLEQIELIQTIKARNLQTEAKIKAEQKELNRLKTPSDQLATPPLQMQSGTPHLISPLDSTDTTQLVIDVDADAEKALIEATMKQ